MPRRIVLIVTPIDKTHVAAVEAAWHCADKVRARGDIPIARVLDRDFSMTPNHLVSEVREFERTLIMRKAIDEVLFTDPDAPDLAEIVALARQYAYAGERADIARKVA